MSDESTGNVPAAAADGRPTLTCKRCSRVQPQMARPPYPGKLGAQIHGNVCGECWAEWQKAEVMVINELRLNFMDPKAQDLLATQLREFLFLDPA